MKTSVISKLMAGLALLSMSAPAAFADHDNHRGNGKNKHYGYDNGKGRYSNQTVYYSKHNKVKYKNKYNDNNNRDHWKNNNSWNWDKHNWNDQRAQLRSNWQWNNDAHFSRMQQQQLDAQMKTQWQQYHNNKWTGQYGWSQYNDPQFLDYVHNNNPSLLTTLRTRFGF